MRYLIRGELYLVSVFLALFGIPVPFMSMHPHVNNAYQPFKCEQMERKVEIQSILGGIYGIQMNENEM